jgi:hypothetical protein
MQYRNQRGCTRPLVLSQSIKDDNGSRPVRGTGTGSVERVGTWFSSCKTIYLSSWISSIHINLTPSLQQTTSYQFIELDIRRFCFHRFSCDIVSIHRLSPIHLASQDYLSRSMRDSGGSRLLTEKIVWWIICALAYTPTPN